MATYIQDYLYTELPNDFVVDVVQTFRVHEYKDLPVASQLYLLTLAMTDDGNCYLCVNDGTGYRWAALLDSSFETRLQALTNALNRLAQKVGEQTTDIASLQRSVGNLQKSIDEVNESLGNVVADQGELDVKMDLLNSEVDTLKENVETLLGLQTRVDELERTVEELKVKFGNYPELPAFDSEAVGYVYYTLVFDSEGKAQWCRNLIGPPM